MILLVERETGMGDTDASTREKRESQVGVGRRKLHFAMEDWVDEQKPSGAGGTILQKWFDLPCQPSEYLRWIVRGVRRGRTCLA